MATTIGAGAARGATRVLGGVTVSASPLIQRALAHVHLHTSPYLYNHSVRSWLFAVRLGQLKKIPADPEVVAVGTLLHDLGLTPALVGSRRFEIEGADAARGFALQEGLDKHQAQLIWDSVALNSTPSIGMYKEAEVALVTAGVGADFGGPEHDRIPPVEMRAILAAFPRLNMKRAFTDDICRICTTRPATTYDNFAGDFGERFIPGYQRPSVVDYLMNGPFEE